MRSKAGRIGTERVQMLTKHEIDQRIERVIAEVASTGGAEPSSTHGPRPQWISAAELIRRVKPFVVLN